MSTKCTGIMKRSIAGKRWRHKYFSTNNKTRAGFGSFHSEDIEVLIRQSNEEYRIPEVYQEVQEESDLLIKKLVSNNLKPGKSLMSTLYSLDPKWTFINHGAFGATCVVGQQESNKWRQICDAQPLRFYDRIMLPVVAHVIRCVASYFNCLPTQLVPLPNVTAGLNAVAHSTPLKPGDEVACFSITYGSTKKILTYACSKAGAKLNIIPLPLPILSKDSIIEAIKSNVNRNTKLILIDTITSNTALRLPVEEIAVACRINAHENCLIVADGAHAMFADDVDLSTSTDRISDDNAHGRKVSNSNSDDVATKRLADVIDVFLTNGHKWLSAPKGCAFMWLSPRAHGICPAIISHGFAPDASRIASGIASPVISLRDKILSGFSWDGCRDYSALMTVPSMLRFWNAIDDNLEYLAVNYKSKGRSRSYMNNLLSEATALLTQNWGIDENRFAGPVELRIGAPMSLVPLPKVRGMDTSKNMTDVQAFQLQELLHHDYKVEVPIKCLEGALFVRISAHIYNEIQDYEKLARILSDLSLRV